MQCNTSSALITHLDLDSCLAVVPSMPLSTGNIGRCDQCGRHILLWEMPTSRDQGESERCHFEAHVESRPPCTAGAGHETGVTTAVVDADTMVASVETHSLRSYRESQW